MTTTHGLICTPAGFVAGRLVAWQGRVVEITGEPIPVDQVMHDGRDIVLPGFIDAHVHGGRGFDIMQGGRAAAEVARCHVRYGTTSLLATTMTAPMPEIRAALEALAPTCRQRPEGGARVLGVHLEGPYINPKRLGAQPDFPAELDFDELLALHAIAPIKVITLAPEVNGHLECITALRDAGFNVQIGHSMGTYEDGVAALERGASSFTHLFNAMSPLHHREPGMVGAALAHARYAELIPDLLHVHPGALKVALRAIDCAYCVTDSTSATGMPDGPYMLGRYRVVKCMGGVRLPNNVLAGSALTMDQALRNLIKLGLPLDDAVRRVSTFVADYLGMPHLGRLEVGAAADIVVMDQHLNLRNVFVEGVEIDLEDASRELASA